MLVGQGMEQEAEGRAKVDGEKISMSSVRYLCICSTFSGMAYQMENLS